MISVFSRVACEKLLIAGAIHIFPCSDRQPGSVSVKVGIEDTEEEADDTSAEAKHPKRREKFLAESAGDGTDVVGSVVEFGVHGREGGLEPVTSTRIGIRELEEGGGKLFRGCRESGCVDADFLGQ